MNLSVEQGLFEMSQYVDTTYILSYFEPSNRPRYIESALLEGALNEVLL